MVADGGWHCAHRPILRWPGQRRQVPDLLCLWLRPSLKVVKPLRPIVIHISEKRLVKYSSQFVFSTSRMSGYSYGTMTPLAERLGSHSSRLLPLSDPRGAARDNLNPCQ